MGLPLLLASLAPAGGTGHFEKWMERARDEVAQALRAADDGTGAPAQAAAVS